MGNLHLPTVFTDSAAEVPSASKLNNDFSHVNAAPWNLLSNGDMEDWSSGAAAAPDNWTLAGTGAAVARSTDEAHGTYAAQVTYGVADSYLYQTLASITYHKGKYVRVWAEVKCSTPSIARVKVYDGVSTSASDFHTGGGDYEHLMVRHLVSESATTLRVEVHVEGAGSAVFDVATLVDDEDIERWLPSVSDVLTVGSVVVYTEGTQADRLASSPSRITVWIETDTGQAYLYSTTLSTWIPIG